MPTVEVHTLGGSDYMVPVFNAVAAWTGSGGYASMLQVVMVLGLIMSTLIVAFEMNVKAWLNWFITSTLIYMTLMVPKVDVIIMDKMVGPLPIANVGNVPLGLGVLASFSSQVGDYLTESAEVVFSMPDEVRYASGGVVWGSQLLESARQLRISDPEFAANLDEHFKMCVFYDIALGHKSIRALDGAADLWAAIGPGSPARSQRFLTRHSDNSVSSTIITCQAAYTAMTPQWETIVNSMKLPFARMLYPKVPEAQLVARLEAQLPITHAYLLGVSKTATDTMKQALAINAMKQATHTMTAGGAVDVYAQTRAEIQTQSVYNTIAHSAMKWVPILHVVLTILFYAMFPILFPLFLFPSGGVPALKGYVFGFFYLAAWGPLFVILHFIMMSRAASTGASVSVGQGMTLMNTTGVEAIYSDVSMLAGYMVATIPFLAASIGKGAMAIGGQAASFLAPSQQAASEAGREAATGSFALGQTSMETNSFNSRQGNQWNTAGSYFGGAGFSSFRQPDGQVTRYGQDGTPIVDTSESTSKLPFMPQLSSELRGAFSTTAAESKSKAEGLENRASSSIQSSMSKFSDFRRTVSEGNALETSFGAADQSSIRNGFSQIDQGSQMLQETFGLSKERADSEATAMMLGLNTGLGGSGGFGGGGGAPRGSVSAGSSGGLKMSATATASDGTSQRLSDARTALRQFAEQNSWDDTRESFMRSSANSSSSDVAQKASGMTTTLMESQSLSRDATQRYEEAQRLEKAATLTDSNGLSVSENMSQAFVEYVVGEQEKMRAMGMTPDWNPTRNMPRTPEEQAEKAFYMKSFVAQEAEKIRAGVEPSFVEPTPAGLMQPSVNSQAGVRRHHEDARGGVPSPAGHASAPLRSAEELQDIRDARTQGVEQGADFVGRNVDHKANIGEQVGRAVRADDRLRRDDD